MTAHQRHQTELCRLCFGAWFKSKKYAYQVTGIGTNPNKKGGLLNQYDCQKYDLKTKEPLDEIEFNIYQIKKGLETKKIKFI